MQTVVDGAVQFSAADLVGHPYCRHLTQLDAAVLSANLKAPKNFDPLLELLWRRGFAHEQAYIDHLKDTGHEVVVIETDGFLDAKRVDLTGGAMRAGAEIIVQGAVVNGR